MLSVVSLADHKNEKNWSNQKHEEKEWQKRCALNILGDTLWQIIHKIILSIM